MSEHVSVIATLAICLSHVYTQFAVCPRIGYTSKKKWETGKSILLELSRSLIFRTNEEALGTGAAVRDHLIAGPGSIALDEIDQADADARRKLSQLWNLGHRRGAKISLMVGGQKKLVSIYCPIFTAGFLTFLAGGQKSRLFNLEMERYTEETKPKRDYYSSDLDEAELENVHAYLCRWAPTAKLDLKPPMPPGVIARDADNVRGLLAVARSFGEGWEQRAHAAITFLLARERAERSEIALCRHTLVILDMLEPGKDVVVVDELGDLAIRSTRLNKELKQLDLADANWNRYCGPSGTEYEHPLLLNEQVELFHEAGVPVKQYWPTGPRKRGTQLQGIKRSDVEAALRKHEGQPGRPLLRLITPGAE
jgi:hypothetical protein